MHPVKKALLISLFVSAISLTLKIVAFFITGSTAALSDSLESVVHFVAMVFVVYGYYLSIKPADDDHHYGHERIELLSVGVEGGIIMVAGITIVYHGIQSVLFGVEIQNMDLGIALLVGAALINLLLGSYVLRVGRREKNNIAISNGKHTLTDVWTSAGVVAALLIIHFTGWLFIDVIISLAIAAYIMFEGYKLLRFAITGIMDTRNPDIDEAIRSVLANKLPDGIHDWHHLRHRTSGNTTWIELHLVFDDEIYLKNAHDKATVLERSIIDALDTDAIITMHLEPYHTHDEAHQILDGANRKTDLDSFA